MFAAIRPGLTEPEGHFRSFFAVSTQKYGLARQSQCCDVFLLTHKTLEGIISKDTPRIRVFNKAEICDEARRTELLQNFNYLTESVIGVIL